MNKITKLNNAIKLLENEFEDEADFLRERMHEILMSNPPSREILQVRNHFDYKRGIGELAYLERLHKKSNESLVRNLKTNEEHWIHRGNFVKTKLKTGKRVKIGDQDYILRNILHDDDKLFFYVEDTDCNYSLKEIVDYNYKHYPWNSECIWEEK